MSAEDLLERSDVQTVPVHMRSRSSPTADKRQDVLLGKNSDFGLMKDPCYLAGPGSRPFSCSSREEMPALRHYPSPHWGDSGCKAGSGGTSVPNGGPGPLDPPRQASRTPCPPPLSSGAHRHLPDARAAPLSSVLPALALRAIAHRPQHSPPHQPGPPEAAAATARPSLPALSVEWKSAQGCGPPRPG